MSDEGNGENGRTSMFTREAMRRILRGDDRRSSSPSFIGVSISALAALAGLVVFAVSFGRDLGTATQRIDMIEKRQVEDRATTGKKITDLDGKVEKIDDKVDLILQEIRAMQAEQRAERRARREER